MMPDGFVPSTTDISSFQTLIALLANPKAIQHVLADMRDLAERGENASAAADAKQQATSDDIERLENLKRDTDRKLAELQTAATVMDKRELAMKSRDATAAERDANLSKREADVFDREQR
jgi:hypothetical protein